MVVPVQWLEDDVSRHCVVGSIHNLRVPRNVCFSTLSSCTQVENSQLIIAVGLWGARRKVPRDGRSRGRDIASSALCPLTSLCEGVCVSGNGEGVVVGEGAHHFRARLEKLQ